MSIFRRMDYTVNDNDRTGVTACVFFIGFFFHYTVVELENFVSLVLKAYGKRRHWVMMAFKDSKLWCEEQCQALLQGAHFKAQFDWCPFWWKYKTFFHHRRIFSSIQEDEVDLHAARICAPSFRLRRSIITNCTRTPLCFLLHAVC